MKIKSILVPTDFSETANHAMEQAIELAIRTRAKVHLFHVIEPRVEGPERLVTAVRDYLKMLEESAEQSLALKADLFRGNGVDMKYSTMRHVSPFEAILEKVEEEKPDLVVVGTHGRTGFGRLLLGSVAEKVLRHAPSNVLTLNKSAPLVRASHAFERILVPVDFSEFSKRAVGLAASLLVPDGVLRVAHIVARPVDPVFYAGGATLFQLDPGLPGQIRESLSKWLEGQTGQIEVREGDVVAEIFDIAESGGAQLIVMGTRGLSGLDHFLMGSVTEKVARRSKIPVLTVHG